MKNKNKVILTSGLSIMLPVVKIVGNWCNLKCDYCFYYTKNQNNKTVMTEDILEKFIAEYLDLFEGDLKFTWHGGEPLLAGIEFFNKIIEFQRKYSNDKHRILNTLQTNGTLVNEEWARFFKKHDFRIGISLDGTEVYHNKFRKNNKNSGSFKQAIRGVEILKKHNVPLGILHVLTHSSVPYTSKNLDLFFKKLKIKTIGSIIYSIAGNALMKGEKIENKELMSFYQTLIDFWLNEDSPNLKSREIENFISGVIGKQATLCEFGGTCTGFFCLDYDGKIYPCDKLSGRPEFYWGNLSRQSLLNILNSRARLEYAKKANTLPVDCLRCKWKHGCHNGCPACLNDQGKYYFCEARKETFEYVAEIIKNFKVQSPKRTYNIL